MTLESTRQHKEQIRAFSIGSSGLSKFWVSGRKAVIYLCNNLESAGHIGKDQYRQLGKRLGMCSFHDASNPLKEPAAWLPTQVVRGNGRYHQHRAIACSPPLSRIAYWQRISKEMIRGSECRFLPDHQLLVSNKLSDSRAWFWPCLYLVTEEVDDPLVCKVGFSDKRPIDLS
jgi:hypothetical protein